MTERRKSTLQDGAPRVVGDDVASAEASYGVWLRGTARRALAWLAEHNGGGVFDKRGALLAAGELAPVTRATWNRLLEIGMVEPAGARRIRLTTSGQLEAERHDTR